MKIMNKPSGITNVESKVMVPVRLLEQHVNCKHHPIEADEHKVANASKSYSKHFENIFWCTEELEGPGKILDSKTADTFYDWSFTRVILTQSGQQ